MRCFTTCFGSSKHTINQRTSITAALAKKDKNLCHCPDKQEALVPAEAQTAAADAIQIIGDIKDKNEEQLNSGARKKVDFSVETSEVVQIEQEVNHLVEIEEGEDGGKRERRKNEFRSFLYSREKVGEEEKEKTKGAQGEDKADVNSDSSVSSLFTYPRNNRHKNCTTSDDESEVMDIKGSNVVDEVDGKNAEYDSNKEYKDDCGSGALIQEESSESLFSLSIDSRKQFSVEKGEKEVNSPLKPLDKEMNNQNSRHRSQPVSSVLNPIENLSQWEAVRGKTLPLVKHQEKENVDLGQDFTFSGKENPNFVQEFTIPFSDEPTFKQSKQHSGRISYRPEDDDFAVDTSLSSWLVESGKSLTNENSPGSVGNSSSRRAKSPKSFEDRPILGSLTVNELKQMSRSSSPRRSPSCSPDEVPIIGTVGSYWRHSGQVTMDANSVSSCRGLSSIPGQCGKGNMDGNSTPFQTKLEIAVDSGTAKV